MESSSFASRNDGFAAVAAFALTEETSWGKVKEVLKKRTNQRPRNYLKPHLVLGDSKMESYIDSPNCITGITCANFKQQMALSNSIRTAVNRMDVIFMVSGQILLY